MKIDPNAPAFAAATCGDFQSGLTIRAHFASIAMQATVSAMTPSFCEALKIESQKYGVTESDFIAKLSIEYADSLIKELNK